MNRRSRVRFWYALPLILLAFSCASTPPKQPEQTPVVPESKPQVAETPPPPAPIPVPAEAKAAAEKARAEAASFEAETAFPDDWKAAAALFDSGEKSYGADNAVSRTSFEAAAKAFGDLVEKAKPLFLDRLAKARSAAEQERKRAIDLDSRKYFPDDWKAAESQFVGGEKAYEIDNAAARVSYEAAARSFKDLADKTRLTIGEKIAAARANAEQWRKYAFDLEAQTALPNEWKTAEAFFLKGRDRSTAANAGSLPAYPETLSAYEAAYAAFDDLVRRSLPLFAEARRSELEKARTDAVSMKADALDPDRFTVAEAASAEVVRLYRAGEYYPAHEVWKSARDRYYSLATGSRAYALKTEIDTRNFAVYDSGNYALAGEKLEAAKLAFDSGKADVSLDAAEEAQLRYKLALAKGFELYAVDRGKAAEAQRVAAFGLKAHVAVKVDYDVAVKVKIAADAFFKSGKHEEAARQYIDAEERFSVVRQSAAEKRKAAEAAIADAERRMQESEKTARDADAVIEGGAQ